MNDKKSISFLDYFEIIVKWRKFIIRNVAIVTVASLVISLLLIQQFTATALILPPSPEQEAMFGMLSLNIPSSLAGLSGIGGVLPGLTTPSDLFAVIMKSGRIKGEIVRKFDLKREFRAKTMTDALNFLDGITQIEVTPEGLVSVSVTYKNKYLAANIANAYIEELDKFNTETAMTVGKRYRIFMEQRLEETTNDLAKSEEALRSFQEEHRTVALEEEIVSAIQTIAEIKSQIILLEVKKGALASSSQFSNPYLYDVNRELRELKKQLAKIEFGEQDTTKKAFGAGFAIPFSELPEVSLEFVRLLRDVKVQEQIYELLTQQYEQAKIMELKDTPTVQFLDRASPAEKKSYPKRSVIIIIAFFCSFAFSVIYVFAVEYFRSGAVAPEQNKKLYEMKKILSGDIKNLFRKIKKIFKK